MDFYEKRAFQRRYKSQKPGQFERVVNLETQRTVGRVHSIVGGRTSCCNDHIFYHAILEGKTQREAFVYRTGDGRVAFYAWIKGLHRFYKRVTCPMGAHA